MIQDYFDYSGSMYGSISATLKFGGLASMYLSNWTFEEANKKAVEEILRLVDNVKNDMILKILYFVDSECEAIN